MKLLCTIAWWLVIIGGINWGLVGLLNLNVIAAIFGSAPALVKIVYILVGLSSLWMLYKKFFKKD